ncbi:MAG: succinate dehydrogenase, cytochrome b556 subunit [Betaproteobacteria bacterium]|nr:succinate dehydrogenase, cytochrome b556 subunit [Betaproteobacteria bacterium]
MADRSVPARRPKYLNLLRIRLPLPGIVSIMHRISGVFLIVVLPFAIYVLDVALTSEEGYAAVAAAFAHPLAQLATFTCLWALYHHLCAGIRFLLIEMHVGVELAAARASAAAAVAAGFLLAVAHSGALFL